MGTKFEFVDNYVGGWVGKEEKDELIADSTPLPVVNAYFDPEGGYKQADRFVLVTTLDGEERSISVPAGGVGSRDNLFRSLIVHLADEDAEPVTLEMYQEGQMKLFRVVEG